MIGLEGGREEVEWQAAMARGGPGYAGSDMMDALGLLIIVLIDMRGLKDAEQPE